VQWLGPQRRPLDGPPKVPQRRTWADEHDELVFVMRKPEDRFARVR
jgi:hypothetical protein